MESATNITKPAEQRYTAASTIEGIRDLFSSKSGSMSGSGVSALLTRAAISRLPAPLKLIAPVIVEKVIMKYGVEEGRELLLKGLRWVKKVTDEKPEPVTY